MGTQSKGKEIISPVKRIVFNNYGQTGLQIYELIDGRRTSHDIMLKSGVSESRLSEIIHFMIEQGILKVDYPRAQGI